MIQRLNKKQQIGSIILFLILLGLIYFNNFEKLFYSPLITPDAWLEIQPWVELKILSLNIILVQPTSTLFVFLLGFLTLGIGISLFRNKNTSKSHEWWGIALILWGLGALFAGTSYQAFSYEIKCVGREFCLWTSWWEVFYLVLSVGSVNAMMTAQAYSCVSKNNKKFLFYYASANMTIYSIIILVGSFIPVRFLISFELMLLFLAPSILFFLVLNSWRYFKYNQLDKYQMDKAMIVVWISLAFIMASYYLYLTLDITNVLWEKGIWFSENDILHIGLILWMVYIRRTVVNCVKDYSQLNT